MTRTTTRIRSAFIQADSGISLPSREAVVRCSPALLAVPVLFNLALYGAVVQGTESPSDLSLHIPMVEWAKNQLLSGHIPLDGWFPNFSLGSSEFHRYQSLPALVTAVFALVLGSKLAVHASLFLLWSFWPVCIYWSARLFDRSKGEALGAAFVAPLICVVLNTSLVTGYGFDSLAYMSSGLWTQLWAAWFMPLALGFSWRAMAGRGRILWAALTLAGCICSDVLIGYFACLLLVPIALSTLRPFKIRMVRAVCIGVGALAIASWLLGPAISDLAYAPQSQYLINSSGANSVGLQNVLRWLFTGQILDSGHLMIADPNTGVPFDAGQLPVISVLAALGTIVAATRVRRDPSARAFLLCALVSVMCYAGPATFPFLRWLPGGHAVLFHRFLGPLQLCGILLAGIGAAWCGGQLWTRIPRRVAIPAPVRSVIMAALIVAILWTPAMSRMHFATAMTSVLDSQTASDSSYDEVVFDSMLAKIHADGPGRVYAGSRTNWGQTFLLGYVAVHQILAYHYVDQIGESGRVQSLSTDPEINFDETNPGDYKAFAVRYMILPSTMKPPVPATFLVGDSTLGMILYEVRGVPATYMSVVDTVGPTVHANNADLGPLSTSILRGSDLQNDLYHPMQFASTPPGRPSWAGPGAPAVAPGTVLSEHDDLQTGDVSAQVTARRSSVALLSASFDNRWTVTVDGAPATPQMIAPSLVGVAIPSGTHTVHFHYAPYPYYWVWLALGLIAIVVLRWPLVIASWVRSPKLRARSAAVSP